jgi:transposase-like protein
MTRKIAPSAQKVQELAQWLAGQSDVHNGEEVLRALIRLSTERVLHEVLEQEQTEALGRSRYERQPRAQGYRNGYEDGTVKTAEGVFRLQLPQVRGLREPYRSKLWAALGRTSEVLTRRIVEMYAGGMAQRDIESALEKALGQCVISKSAVSDITDRLSHEYEAFRTRDLSGFDLASLFMDTVYEPLRRWGSKTGILCVWGICVDGRKVLLTLSTAHSESYESCLEVLRDLVKRGLQTPVTITTDGAPGLIKAIDAMWPRALRIRCWFHKMQNLHQKVPPQAWPAFKALVADMRDAPTCEAGQRRQQAILAHYQDTFPEACRCLEDDAEASLNHLKVPARHRQYVRTSNLAERAFEEERRRTKVIPQLWDEASLVKLVFAVLIRVSERWGKKQFSEFKQHQIRALRQTLHLDHSLVPLEDLTKERRPRRRAVSAQ